MPGARKKPAACRALTLRKGHSQRPRLIYNERELIALCLALISSRTQLSRSEQELAHGIQPWDEPRLVKDVRKHIRTGADPLGDVFLGIRSPATRRDLGAVYTPDPIISSMLNWCSDQISPDRVIDPGAGSGRYLLAAAERFPKAQLIGVELDPLAALMLRANLEARGLTHRASVLVTDFRNVELPGIDGATLFLGNPPYVRHHHIGDAWKDWYSQSAKAYGIKASKLAGLHIHFFLRALQLARAGDVGAFITSAEWLDVNYGTALRQMLTHHLGGIAVHLLDARARPFEDAATTAAITCFKVGEQSKGLRVRSVETLEGLNGLSTGQIVPWADIKPSSRWSPLFRPSRVTPTGFVELGEICRVHRGQVTGGNSVWIAGPHAAELPENVLIPAITKARDLLSAGMALNSCHPLRRVIDIPPDLDALEKDEKRAVERFLRWAKSQGAGESYIAKHRRAWWSVGLRDPAPILCTYMARRAPAFVRNLCGARHINVAHGLYPREELSNQTLDRLADWLRNNVVTDDGRTYAGGLTKFEPKELERVLVPDLQALMP